MLQRMPAAIWYDPAERQIKTALTLDDLAAFSWTPAIASSNDIEAAYHAAAPLYAAIQQRAKALAALPWRLVNQRGDAVANFDLDACADLLFALEIDYLLHGAAYALRDIAAPLGLRRLHPRTITPVIDRRQGVTGFRRARGDGETQALPLDVVVHIWEANAAAEVGPGVSSAQRALMHAQHIIAETQYVTAYYQRGAVRPTVWTVQGPISSAEADRFQTWLRSLLSGIRNAFRQIALTQKVEAITLGDKLSDVLTPEAGQAAIEAILTALQVPHSLVIPSAANYATAERDYQNFMLLTVLPQARRYAAALTNQHFARQRLRLEVNEAQVEAVQRSELEKAQALGGLIAAGVITATEARERLELEPLDDPVAEVQRGQIAARLALAQQAVALGIDLAQALALADLDPALASAPASDEIETEPIPLDLIDWNAATMADQMMSAETKAPLAAEQRSEIARQAALARWRNAPRAQKPARADRRQRAQQARAQQQRETLAAIGVDASALEALLSAGVVVDEAQASAFIDAGLAERLSTGDVVSTPAARLLAAAAAAGDAGRAREVMARARAAAQQRRTRAQEQAQREQARQQREQERAQERSRQRGGRGGGGGSARDREQERAQERSRQRTEMLAAEGLSQIEIDSLVDLRDGREITDEAGEALQRRGLVERDESGAWLLTALGRTALSAAERGDAGRVRDALIRARSALRADWSEAIEDWSAEASIKAQEELSEQERRIYRALLDAFERYAPDLAALAEAGDWQTLARRWSEEVGSALRASIAPAVADAIEQYAEQIGIDTDPAEINRLALQWSMRRSQYLAEGLMWPATRDAVEAIVTNWRATPGADRDALVRALAPVVSARRAETVAITTATEAATAGARAYRDYLRDAYQLDYELVWETANDERVCPICAALHRKPESAWGASEGPPAHPRCRCGVSYRRRRV